MVLLNIDDRHFCILYKELDVKRTWNVKKHVNITRTQKKILLKTAKNKYFNN